MDLHRWGYSCLAENRQPPDGVARQLLGQGHKFIHVDMDSYFVAVELLDAPWLRERPVAVGGKATDRGVICLLYTSPSPRDQRGSRMPSSA